MNRGDAYAILATRLEQFRSLGYRALLSLVDRPTASETIHVHGEDVVVETSVRWRDEKRKTLCVHATAYGPSTWAMQRLDERIIVRPDAIDSQSA